MRLGANGWTGGQYSVWRVALGLWLAVHLVRLLVGGAAAPLLAAGPAGRWLPSGAGVAVTWLFCAACLASAVALAIGLFDRVAALVLAVGWAGLHGVDLRAADPGMAALSAVLVLHAAVPPAPYGSWARRGQADPGVRWAKPGFVHAAGWALLVLGYAWAGWGARSSLSLCAGGGPPVRGLLAAGQLAFAALALVPPLRRCLWVVGLGLLVVPLAAGTAAVPGAGLVLLQLFCFDPSWVPAVRPGRVGVLFFDGHCGLCHRAVRFVIAEDRRGEAFRLAPLDSDAFRAAVPEAVRPRLPDSLIVRTAEGVLLYRSAAILHIGRRLGGLWRLAAGLVALAPVGVRDRAYDLVARIRYRLFARPAEACPLVPPELRVRFGP
ncbi:MAG TPA: DCC1-like thiol-disulfide oxidoreductase family protein [Myxococcota bacterium]|jgi:prepilin-type processing-associated H-X9-DG protein|nr:DCC1-like thiol-disulfide oxidoreductase family protein [Myxococcota bacterium]